MFLPRLAALVALLLCLVALPATAQDSPNLEGLRLVAEDLKIASNLAYAQARATAPPGASAPRGSGPPGTNPASVTRWDVRAAGARSTLPGRSPGAGPARPGTPSRGSRWW